MPLEGHLDELRSRLIVSIAVFGVALGLCFWQNHLLLELASRPLPDNHGQLITFGVTEPFATTMKVAAYGAVILSLPVLLYQLYAFFMPALSRQQRRSVAPLVILTPILFIAGVLFGYFVVAPAALQFLLNFNDSQFNVQVRASEYYGFFASTLIACGVVFEVPVAILGAVRLEDRAGASTPGGSRARSAPAGCRPAPTRRRCHPPCHRAESRRGRQ